MTNEKTLTSNLEAGSSAKYEIEENDVGEVNKILIKIEGTTPYRCKSVSVQNASSSLNFPCLKKLTPCTKGINDFSCMDELLPEGGYAYEVTLKSSNTMESYLNSPILITLIGSKGISNTQMLTETGIGIGAQVIGVIKTKELGKITGYKIEISEPGKFKGSYLLVKDIKSGLISTFDLKEVNLENPIKNSFSYDSEPRDKPENISNLDRNDKKPKSESPFKKLFDNADDVFDKETNPEQEEDDGITTLISESSDTLKPTPASLDNGIGEDINLHNPKGGLMNSKEKRGNNFFIKNIMLNI